MKPNDQNGALPPARRPFRVLILAGSNRRQYNCPGVDSKARVLMFRMADRLPQEWEIDFEDLGNVYGRARRPCHRCGTPIRAQRQGEQARTTYWCPTCQK